MLDQAIRARLAPRLDRAGARLAPTGISPAALTAVGLLAGAGARVAAATASWDAALVLWLGNRLLDGLDGSLARRRGATELGGLLDFVADFVVYSGFVVGVAIADPAARLACVVLARHLPGQQRGAAVLLLDDRTAGSELRRRAITAVDDRARRGTETIVVYTLFCLLPGASEAIAWAFAGLVALTAVQRVAHAVRTLPRRSVLDPQALSASRQSDA